MLWILMVQHPGCFQIIARPLDCGWRCRFGYTRQRSRRRNRRHDASINNICNMRIQSSSFAKIIIVRIHCSSSITIVSIALATIVHGVRGVVNGFVPAIFQRERFPPCTAAVRERTCTRRRRRRCWRIRIQHACRGLHGLTVPC